MSTFLRKDFQNAAKDKILILFYVHFKVETPAETHVYLQRCPKLIDNWSFTIVF